MAIKGDGISIGTVSGGVVNFGGAVNITPISVTKTITGAGGSNSGAFISTNSGGSGSGSGSGTSDGSSSTGSNGSTGGAQSTRSSSGGTAGSANSRPGGSNTRAFLSTNRDCCFFNNGNIAGLVNMIIRSLE